MTTTITCRRKQRRHSAGGSDRAWVELAIAGKQDAPVRLPIVDISVAGLSFAVDGSPVALENGSEIPDVRIKLAGCEIRGELVVMHVTGRDDGQTVCGALFYAATDGDLLKLRSAVAGMEALG
jgi:hypothetical protein